jgi:hypothetical protein
MVFKHFMSGLGIEGALLPLQSKFLWRRNNILSSLLREKRVGGVLIVIII